MYVMRKVYGFSQSMDCPAQSINRYFAQQSMDLSRFVAHSMDCPVGTLPTVWPQNGVTSVLAYGLIHTLHNIAIYIGHRIRSYIATYFIFKPNSHAFTGSQLTLNNLCTNCTTAAQ